MTLEEKMQRQIYGEKKLRTDGFKVTNYNFSEFLDGFRTIKITSQLKNCRENLPNEEIQTFFYET